MAMVSSQPPDSIYVNVDAGRDLWLQGDLLAKTGRSLYGGGSDVVLSASRRLTLDKKLQVTANDGGSTEFAIGPACAVAINGTVRANTSPGVTSVVSYRDSLTFGPRAKLQTTKGSNQIRCACSDPNHDGLCDGGCLSEPIGLAGARIRPTAEIVPTALGPCGP